MSRAQVPPPGNIHVPKMMPQRPNVQEQALMAMVADMAKQIYVRTVADYMATMGERPLDLSQLKVMALEAEDAAKAFFEGIGRADFSSQTPGADDGQTQGQGQ